MCDEAQSLRGVQSLEHPDGQPSFVACPTRFSVALQIRSLRSRSCSHEYVCGKHRLVEVSGSFARHMCTPVTQLM